MNTKLLHNGHLCLLLMLALLAASPLWGQRVMQIERYGNPKSRKIFIGEEITYRLKNDKTWYTRAIEDYRLDQNMIVAADRYIKVDEIAALRYERGWPRVLGRQLFWFGTGWSFYGLVGFAVDGNPNTHYRWADAIVTGTSWTTALLLPKIFKYKKIKINDRRRLRLVDINFRP